MRRGQATAEAGLAALLVAALVAGMLAVGGAAWVRAEVAVAEVAADGARRAGDDPLAAAAAAVPAGIRARVVGELQR
jgi:hypothetical protein